MGTTTSTGTGTPVERGQTPSALPVPEASAFPDALVQTPHWVGYALETGKGKVPKNPHTGKNASTTDPTTWADFATARAFALRTGYGLGFMLAPPFVGIDMDDCLNVATGALSTLGASVLGELDTYAEVSISGTGVKAIAYGEKPGPRCRRNGLELEIYSSKRLFALTGQRLSDAPLQINDCQDAVNHIYVTAFGLAAPDPTPSAPAFVTDDDDRTVIDWLSTYNRKFPALWAGDTSAYNGDDSATDQALCNMLAFRTGDENRVDSLFRLSGLYRPKWERGDYRHRTITKAMQQRRFFTPAPTLSSVDRPPSDDALPPWEDEPPAATTPPPDPGDDCPAQLGQALRRVVELEQTVHALLLLHQAAERHIVTLGERLDATHALLTNKGQPNAKPPTPADRLADYAILIEATAAASQGKQSDADPRAVPVNPYVIAENIGLSRQTITKRLNHLDERGLLRKVGSPKVNRDGTPYTELAVCLPGSTLTENLRAAASWTRPEGAKSVGGNGNRCGQCGSTETKKTVETKTVETTTLACAGCGHVHTQTTRIVGTPRTTYSFGELTADTPAIFAARRTPSSVDTPPSPDATPAPVLSTVGGATTPAADDAYLTVDSPSVMSRRTPSASPPPVSYTHLTLPTNREV